MSGARPGRAHRASRLTLKREHVLGLAVQAGVPAVDDLEVARVLLFPPDLCEVAAERGLDDLRAVAGWAGEVVDRFDNIFRQCDRCLHFHTTNILPAVRVRQLWARHFTSKGCRRQPGTWIEAAGA